MLTDFRPIPPVPADPEALLQALQNLVKNAAEAIPGPGTVTVARRGAEGAAVVSVTDTGPGMSEDFVRTSLFAPFRSTKDGGWGIGLFQARDIIERHGGTIAVTSTPGRGTTFRVRLPVAGEAVAGASGAWREGPREPAGQDRVATVTGPGRLEPARLLIVEDDEAIQTQLKYALRDEFSLVFAGDRPQALARLREAQPPVVTLDLGLPPAAHTAEEGLKTLEEILRAAPATRVLVLTGNADRANALRAVQAGAFDYQAKPVDIDALRVVLRRALFLHGVETEAAHAGERRRGGGPLRGDRRAPRPRCARSSTS